MSAKLRFLGLDIHAESIAVAIVESEGEARSLGTIPNRSESIRKLIKELGPADKLARCYRSGDLTVVTCPKGGLLVQVNYFRLADHPDRT